MVPSAMPDDDHAAPSDPHDVDRRPLSSLLAASQPGRPRRHLGPTSGASQLTGSTDDAPDPARALHVVEHAGGWGLRVGKADVERVFATKQAAWRNAVAWANMEDRAVVVHGDAIEVPAPER